MDGNDSEYSNGTYKFGEMLLYNLDRTLAIVALGAIGVAAAFLKQVDIVLAVVAALGVYAGVKGGK